MKIKNGEKLPDAKVFIFDKDPKETSIKQIIGDDRVIIFGIPGAFTPTCSTKHLPGFMASDNQLSKKNIKKVICISVNDPFVMDAWGKAHNVQNKILMVADYNLDFTKKIGSELDLNKRGLGIRSSRYTMLIEKGNVVKISEEEVAGKCERTAAENFLKEI
jgi:peroxiredoxin (alkyl hydroperoxide reductase subunit C)|tara:strand:+ start:663 stop:1145 length:483 start_codon:yes stop_codon:yes gene_type:complete